MASEISTLLATQKLYSSLPVTGPNSLYKIFQSLFLIECPFDDPATLQAIQLNAAFLEYLSTQRASAIKVLLQEWEQTSRNTGENKERENFEMEYARILDDFEEYMVKEVRTVCVYFEGQDVEALVRTREIKEKVRGILEKAGGGKPRFICQPREI